MVEFGFSQKRGLYQANKKKIIKSAKDECIK